MARKEWHDLMSRERQVDLAREQAQGKPIRSVANALPNRLRVDHLRDDQRLEQDLREVWE